MKKRICLVLSIILSLVLLSGLMTSCGSSANIKMPDLVGKTRQQAEETLKSSGVKYNIEKLHSEKAGEGTVIDQSIKPNTEIASDEAVTLVISLGKQLYFPNIVNKSKSDAEKTLKDLSIKLVVENEVYSNTVGKGLVISQKPKAGEKAEKGETVTVTISKGVEMVKVPNVKGLKLENAKNKLKDAKLKYSISKEYSSSVKKNKVIKQTKSGKTVKINTTIHLTVSKGKKPVPATQPSSSSPTRRYTPSTRATTPQRNTNPAKKIVIDEDI